MGRATVTAPYIPPDIALAFVAGALAGALPISIVCRIVYGVWPWNLPWYVPLGSRTSGRPYWSATYDDLSDLGRQLVDALEAAYDVRPILVTLLDT